MIALASSRHRAPSDKSYQIRPERTIFVPMSRKLAITGGARFVGSNLIHTQAEENDVVVFDDLSTGKRENLAGGIHQDIRHSAKTQNLKNASGDNPMHNNINNSKILNLGEAACL